MKLKQPLKSRISEQDFVVWVGLCATVAVVRDSGDFAYAVVDSCYVQQLRNHIHHSLGQYPKRILFFVADCLEL